MTVALEVGEQSEARPGRTLSPGKDPVSIVQEAGWALGPVWTGGKSRPTENRFPDRPARSSVAIPTELPGPQYVYRKTEMKRESGSKFVLRTCLILHYGFEQTSCPNATVMSVYGTDGICLN